MPFLPSVFPPPKRWTGPTDRGSWAFALPGVPGDRTGINSPTAGCSLGLNPPRVSRPKPCSGFRPNSSHALSAPRFSAGHAGASECQSALAWPHPCRPASRAERTGQPLQGFRTCTTPYTRAKHRPGYVFTSYRAVHRCRQPVILGQSTSLYRSCPGVA